MGGMDAVTQSRCRSTSRCCSTHPAAPSGPGSRRRSPSSPAQPVELTMRDRRRARAWAAARRSTSCSRTPATTCSGTGATATHDDARGRGRPRPARRPGWRALSFDDRAAIFLKAADLLAGPWRRPAQRRDDARPVARPPIQAEIDAACELIDFWRFNVALRARRSSPSSRSPAPGRLEPDRPPAARGLRLRDHAVQLHRDRRQPADRAGADGQHRGLEARATPSSSPRTCSMELLEEAGLPPGVINMVTGDGIAVVRGRARRPATSPGIHFTGSTRVFQQLWRTVGENIAGVPRPTRGSSARPAARTSWSRTRAPTSTCCGRRWSAAPSSTRARSARPRRARTCRASLWPRLRDDLVGRGRGAVDGAGRPTSRTSWVPSSTTARSRGSSQAHRPGRATRPRSTVLAGGTSDDSEGWFVRPTVLRRHRPDRRDLHDRVLRPDPGRPRLRRRGLRRDARADGVGRRRTR